MNSAYFPLIALINLAFSLVATPVVIEKKIEEKSPELVNLFFSVDLGPSLSIYKDHLSVTTDRPDLQVASWTISEAGTDQYDPTLKASTKIYKKKISFNVVLHKKPSASLENAALHIAYYTNDNRQPVQELIVPLIDSGTKSTKNNIPDVIPTLPEPEVQEVPSPTSAPKNSSWSDLISHLIAKQQSVALRLLFVLFLGIMLSLTPCIYPMIPITIGVLHSQSSHSSMTRNFLMALAYTMGISTTFALFGLVAGCVGPLCGQLLSNPWFIVGLVLILAYFALSMLGFYDIRLPRFINIDKMPGGSFFAAYVFGAASGTFASPCVSPGLALILGMVASQGSILLGFLFLFVFGIGLSIPLLVIGTLSNSFHLLPRAGTWMIEVKKLFGLLMIGVCFYYLSFATPLWFVEWLGTITILLLAGFYIYQAATIRSQFWRNFSYLMGILLISTACVTSFYAIKRIFLPAIANCQQDAWLTHYEIARKQAKNQHKLIFLDAWATYCSICIAINKKVLAHPDLQKTLNLFIPVKIDMTNAHNEQVTEIRERFKITGVPALFLIEPHDQRIIKQWGSEIYNMSIEEIQKELLLLANPYN